MPAEKRKPGRPPKDRAPLDRARIVDAALRLADEGGLGALTVRGVADALSVTPMAVYNHVRDKDALALAIFDHVVETYRPADHDEPDVDAWLVTTFARIHRALYDHHALAPLVSAWFAAGPAAISMDLFEACLARLEGAGFTPTAAVRAFYALLGLAVGHASIDAAIRVQLGGEATEAAQRRYEATMAALAAGAHPTVLRFAPALADAFGPKGFEVALRQVVRGLEKTA